MSFGEKLNKNKLATGAGAVNESETLENNLEKTAHISFHMTGPDVDKIDFLGDLELAQKEFNFKVTHGKVDIYYTEKK